MAENQLQLLTEWEREQADKHRRRSPWNVQADSTALEEEAGTTALEEQEQADSDRRWKQARDSIATGPRQPRPEPQRRRRAQPEPSPVGEGYGDLPEPWCTYSKVALRFAPKAVSGEKDDLLHTIIESLAKVGQRKASKGEEFTEAAMHRTAEHIKDWYWYKRYAYNNGLDCRHCTSKQKARCKYNWAHSEWAYADCHRAVRLESLNQPVTDDEGEITELGDLIADDAALDLIEWVDARTWLLGAPIRLKEIAIKRTKGEALSVAERKYLAKLRKRHQLSLSGG